MILGPETEQYAGGAQRPWSLARIGADARRCEALGFDGITSAEAGHDPFLPLVAAAAHTERATLGTNVAIAFPRSPMVTAQLAWDLQQLSGGRFRLGLGTQVKPHVERRYGASWSGPPGPRMREYVQCLQAILSTFAEPAQPRWFRGEHYQFTLMSPFFHPGPIEHPRPPVYLAAVNPYMARLAGELCDGLRLHPISTFRFAREVVLPAVEAGVRRSGRDGRGIDLVGAPFLALGADDAGLEAARRALKQHVAFYASTPTYQSVLDHHGWQEIGQELHQLSRAGRWTDLPDRISDAMLDEWAIVARDDELVPKLRARCAGIFSTLLLDLPPRLRRDEDRVREIVAALQQPS